MSGFPAGFFNDFDVGDLHAAINRLGHVIDGEKDNGTGSQRLHLHAGLSGQAGRCDDPAAGQGALVAPACFSQLVDLLCPCLPVIPRFFASCLAFAGLCAVDPMSG